MGAFGCCFWPVVDCPTTTRGLMASKPFSVCTPPGICTTIRVKGRLKVGIRLGYRYEHGHGRIDPKRVYSCGHGYGYGYRYRYGYGYEYMYILTCTTRGLPCR